MTSLTNQAEAPQWAATLHGTTHVGSKYPKPQNIEFKLLGLLSAEQVSSITEDQLKALFPGAVYVQFGSSDTVEFACISLMDRLDINLFDVRQIRTPEYQNERMSQEQFDQGFEFVVACGFTLPALVKPEIPVNPISKHTIYEDMEAKSKWGVPLEGARLRFWIEIELPSRTPTGKTGCLRAISEMEALDRLREAHPDIKAIQWIPRSQYA